MSNKRKLKKGSKGQESEKIIKYRKEKDFYSSLYFFTLFLSILGPLAAWFVMDAQGGQSDKEKFATAGITLVAFLLANNIAKNKLKKLK